VNRPINYSSLNRYNSVHREVNYNNVRGGSALRDRPLANTGAEVNNKIIQRNINTNDPRLNVYRGRPSQQEQASRPEMNRPEVASPQPSRQEQVQVRPPGNRPEPARPAYQPAARGSERPEAPAFSGNRGGFDAHAASQRGQASRIEARQPAPPSRQQSAPASHESERKR
jgi:hypothetical protein